MNVVLDGVGYMTWRGLVAGAGLGGIYGTFLVPLVGTILGAIFGGLFGLLAGAGCGLLAGTLTRAAFYPLTHPLRYQRILTLSCAVFTFVIGYASFSWMLASLLPTYVLPPAFIAAGAAAYITSGFAAHYSADEFEKPKRKREDVDA